MGRAQSGMEDDGPIADASMMPSFIISNMEEGRGKLSRTLPAESSFAGGKVGDSNRGVIRSNSLDEGDRSSGQRSGAQRAAEGNNNNNCNGGRARRRASAVEVLRRSFGDSKSASFRSSARSRTPSGAERPADAEGCKKGLTRGGGAQCGGCRKSDVGTGRPGDKNEPTSSQLPTCNPPVEHAADERHHVRDKDGNTAALGESVGAEEHVYCTVYCTADDARRADAEITDSVLPSDGTEDDSETGQAAGPSPRLQLYSLDDLVDLMGDASQRQHRDRADTDSEAECCQVCLEEKLSAPLPCCRRPLCAGCLKLYVSSQVKVGKAVISCPNWTCQGTLEEGLVISNLTSEEAAKYRYFVELSQLDTSTKPCPQCNHFTSLKTNNLNRFEHKYKIQCSSCQFVWCFKCHAPWHDGLKCRDYRKADKHLRTWASVIEHGQRNAQKCPQCKIHIQRIEGCDHMTCTQCNTNFCYRCGSRYRHLRFFGDHTSNLSVFGCKYRYLPDKPHLRRLVRGSVCASKVLIAPLVLVLVIVLGALALVIGLFAFPVYYVCKRKKKQQHTRGSGRWI